MPVEVQGPDGKTYQFPDGTDKAAAISYFKRKGIGVKAAAPAPRATPNATIRPLTPIERATTAWEPNPRTDTPLQMLETEGHDVLAGPNQVFYHPIDFVQGMGNMLLHPGDAIRSLYESANTRPISTLATTLGQSAALGAAGELVGPVADAAKAGAKGAGEVGRGAAEHLTGARTGVKKLIDQTQKDNIGNPEAQADYAKKIGKTIQDNKKIEAATQGAKDRTAKIQVQGSQIIDRVRSLDQRLRAKANGMFDGVREKVGNATEPGETLGADARQALKKIAGTSETPKIFKDILAKYPEAEPDTINYQGAAIPKGHALYDVLKQHGAVANPTVSFADLQGYFTETGAELAKGNLPSDVYRATQELHDAIGNQMQRMAKKAGAGDDLITARKFYREYMDTFHEPAGPSGSGSPVAQILLAKDPATAAAKLEGKAGDRALALLRKYDLPTAELAQDLQRTAREKSPAPRTEKRSIGSIEAPQKPKKIGVTDIESAKRGGVHEAAQHVVHRGKWFATWPLFESMRAVWSGEVPSLPGMAAESLGTLGTVHAIAHIMESKPVLDFLSKATPRDIESVPPDLRGQLPRIVKEAQKRNVKLSPALQAYAVTTATLAPRRNPTDEWSDPNSGSR